MGISGNYLCRNSMHYDEYGDLQRGLAQKMREDHTGYTARLNSSKRT
ncbi:MAG TPA: hypothetical protein VHR47_12975 [Bacillota bacterium]|nr:hypothetical protein [Bacillota bacterium]